MIAAPARPTSRCSAPSVAAAAFELWPWVAPGEVMAGPPPATPRAADERPWFNSADCLGKGPEDVPMPGVASNCFSNASPPSIEAITPAPGVMGAAGVVPLPPPTCLIGDEPLPAILRAAAPANGRRVSMGSESRTTRSPTQAPKVPSTGVPQRSSAHKYVCSLQYLGIPQNHRRSCPLTRLVPGPRFASVPVAFIGDTWPHHVCQLLSFKRDCQFTVDLVWHTWIFTQKAKARTPVGAVTHAS